jgi:hypothetical protein
MLSEALDSRKSVVFETRLDLTSHGGDTSKIVFNRIDDTYMATAFGQRRVTSKYYMGDAIFNKVEKYCDGSKCAEVMFRGPSMEQQKSAIIKRHFGMEDQTERLDIPKPELLLYVGRKPLGEALPDALYLGEVKVNGRDCDLFLFRGVKWGVVQDQVFYLDRASSQPIKVEAFRDEESRVRGAPIWVWIADRLETIQGRLVPVESTQLTYDNTGGAPRKLFTNTFRVQSIRFDEELDPALFWPTLAPALPVMDAIANKTYVTPGTPPSAPTTETAASGAGAPIEAERPNEWLDAIPAVTLVLGAGVLIAAGVIWARQR